MRSAPRKPSLFRRKSFVSKINYLQLSSTTSIKFVRLVSTLLHRVPSVLGIVGYNSECPVRPVGKSRTLQSHGYIVLVAALRARVGRHRQAVELLCLTTHLKPPPVKIATQTIVVGFPAPPRFLTDSEVRALHLVQRLHSVETAASKLSARNIKRLTCSRVCLPLSCSGSGPALACGSAQ